MNTISVSVRARLARLFLTLDSPPRLRTAWRLLAHFILFVLCMLLFGNALLLGLYLNLSDDAFFMLNSLVQLVAITLSVTLARRWLDQRSVKSLGLTLDRRMGNDLLAGMAIAGVVMAVIFVAEKALGWLEIAPSAGAGAPPAEMGRLLAWALIFVLVSWQEELLCRGYWLQNIAEGTNLLWGVLFSSILFAALHSGNPNVSWAAIAGLIGAGLFLAYGYVATRRLWMPIGLHIGWNFFEGNVFGFPVSGLENLPRLIRPTVTGPTWVTGGAFGPEAGLIVLPGLLVGAALIWLYARYAGRISRRSRHR